MSEDARIPITILTGFLGSGKTTLLNRILTEPHGLRIAVLENEFGALGIDQELVVKAEDSIFEMNNGCICCTIHDGLNETLVKILNRRDQFDYVLIETTGIADPSKIVSLILMDEDIQPFMRMDGLICLADALHFKQHFEERPEIRKQLAFADVVMINKRDLVPEAYLTALEGLLKQVNPLARYATSAWAEIPIDSVIDIGGFSPERIRDLQANELKAINHGHAHDNITSVAVRFEAELDWDLFATWFETFTQRWARNLYRLKGILAVRGRSKRLVLQGVHELISIEGDRDWEADESRYTTIVAIGKHLKLEDFEQQVRACLAASP